MRDDHKKRSKGRSVKYGRLYGIGIGPGDPKLLTLKAKEILDRVDLVFCPKGDEGGTSWARSIIEATTATSKKCVELTFPMTRDKKVLKAYWQKAAGRIAQELAKGKEGVAVGNSARRVHGAIGRLGLRGISRRNIRPASPARRRYQSLGRL